MRHNFCYLAVEVYPFYANPSKWTNDATETMSKIEYFDLLMFLNNRNMQIKFISMMIFSSGQQ